MRQMKYQEIVLQKSKRKSKRDLANGGFLQFLKASEKKKLVYGVSSHNK